MFGNCLENVRKNSPLIHCITNYVTANDVANVLLASGAKPMMADEPVEAEEIAAIADGLTLNIGTLHQDRVRAMLLAGKRANELRHPVLLDPVGIGASRFRTNTAMDLIRQLRICVIRGNSSEIKTIARESGFGPQLHSLEPGESRGVDASLTDQITENHLKESITYFKELSYNLGSILVVTGSIDLVTDGSQCYVIRNGRWEMSRITGTGCQLSGLITAFLSANPKQKLEAAAAAVCTMGVAGELAMNQLLPDEGNASYRSRIIDAIYNMDKTTLEKEADYEIQ